MTAKKRGLGRGLDSLFDDNSTPEKPSAEIRLSEIEPNRGQPRKTFDDAALAELADSISKHGLLQPITVRPLRDSGYQIIAGERRWRACRMAGLEFVPVVIREVGDREAMELAMIENLQREDLNPVEEAEGYKALLDCGMTQETVAERVGKSRPAVANSLRLLSLGEDVLELLREGKITAGHARALLSLKGEMRDLGVKMTLDGASVREIERLAKRKPEQPKAPETADVAMREVEALLKNALGRKVRVTGKNGKGTVSIDFYSEDELCDIANRLAGDK